MALIKCSECGKEVSDKAKFCPNCAYPLKNEKTKEEVKKRGKIVWSKTRQASPKIFYIIIVLCIIAVIMISAKLMYQNFEYQKNQKHKQDTISRYVGGNFTNIINKEWKTEHKEYYETYIFNEDYSCKYHKSGYTFEWQGETLPSFAETENYYYKVDEKENRVEITIFEINFDTDDIKEIEKMTYFPPHDLGTSHFEASIYAKNNRIFLPDNKSYAE